MDCNIVLNMVNHFNHKSIAFSCYDSRTRKLSIDSYNALGFAKPCDILQFDLQKGKLGKIIISKGRLISAKIECHLFASKTRQ